MLAVSAALEAEAEELLEPRKQRLHHCTPAWATERVSKKTVLREVLFCSKEDCSLVDHSSVEWLS